MVFKSQRITSVILLLSVILLIFTGCSESKVEQEVREEPGGKERPVKVEITEEEVEGQAEESTVTESDGEIKAQEEPQPPVTCSNPAPDFSLRSIDGERISLSDFRGKVVLLDFWATWCRPCVMGIPDLISLQSEYGKEDFVVIGISLDRQPAVVPRFVKQKGINYPIVYGWGESIAADYGNVTSIPTTFIVDRYGCIKQRLVGLHPKTELRKLIAPLIRESV